MGQATVMMGRGWAGDLGSSYECQIRLGQKVLGLHLSAQSPVWLIDSSKRLPGRITRGTKKN